jgi:murein DD-endopeptidase MepM/ murein hydrolase activator NlpD
MKQPSASRAFLLATIICLLAVAVSASAETAVQHHRHQRKQAVRQLHRLRKEQHRILGRLQRERVHAQDLLRIRGRVDLDRWSPIQRWADRELKSTGRDILRQNRSFRKRVRRYQRSRDAHAAWLSTYAVFEVCPVPGYSVIHDDFGEIVRMPGVKPHVHMGSDVQAPYGSRIVAPFDGYAVASSSVGGGYQVRVYGARGYVYNAHLAAFGHTGTVRAGDTVGYVGSTGSSTAPHDHVEWHPGDGGAVDPYLYLALSCIG